MQAGEIPAVTAMLVRAFDDDPGYAALFDTSLRPDALTFLFQRLLQMRLEAGATVWLVDEDGPAAMLSWAPSTVRFGLAEYVRYGLVTAPFRLGFKPVRRMMAADDEVGELRKASQRPEPHAWISQVGVDPRHQRKGLGASLLRTVLDEVDEKGLAAALMTTNPALPAYYARFGFEERGRRDVAAGFTTWFLERPPG